MTVGSGTDEYEQDARLAALQAYDVLDTPPEPDIDDIVRVAAQICQTPVALVTLVDGRRQFFKSRVGYDAVTGDLETGFCPIVVSLGESLTIPDTLRDPRHAGNKATQEGGVRFYAGVPLRTRGGHVIGTLCVLDLKPRELDDGQHTALAALARQVMGQLELRAALRREQESDVRHRLTLDSAVDYAIVGLDLQGVVRDWNTGAERILGVPAAAAIGETVGKALALHNGRDWLTADMRAVLEGGYAAGEGWCRRVDGSAMWARRSLNPLRSSRGGVVGFVLVLLDRTAERRREQSLALLAQAAAGLLTAEDPDAFLGDLLAESGPHVGFQHAYSHVIAPDGRHLRLTASIGLTAEERAFFAHAPFDATTCASVVEARREVVINDIQASDDRRCRPVQSIGLTAYAAFPVMSGDDLHGVLSFGSTERTAFDDEALTFFATLARYVSMVRVKTASERSLRDLASSLEQRVAERTAALQDTEAALRQSQKMEAVGQLTGGVAHDFNNLLTIIRSSTDLLRRPGLPDERRARYLDAVSETVDRAAKLTGQLLAFARRQALNPEVFDVGKRLRKVAELLDSVTGARISVRVEVPAEPCHVRADAGQFETALVNMAVNARDAMAGEGVLVLRVAQVTSLPAIRGHGGSGERFVAVSLSDTGQGIAPEAMDHIFEPFFTTKDVGKGTGLGLSQVFGFAKQSGGDIDVQSVQSEGSTFTLYLPAVEAVGGSSTRDRIQDVAPDGGGRRILVVEDNVEIGQFVTQILEDMGYRTDWVTNAADALNRISRSEPTFDAVFSDVAMPGGMNGIELAHQIRRDRPGLPVILTSGYSDVLAKGGPQGFPLLQKPYSIDQLSHVLGQVIPRPVGNPDSRRVGSA